MVRQLQPWYANLAKRQVKSPKTYIRDSGLLLGIHSSKPLFERPKVEVSWEGFVIEQVLAAETHDEAYFWATHPERRRLFSASPPDQCAALHCNSVSA